MKIEDIDVDAAINSVKELVGKEQKLCLANCYSGCNRELKQACHPQKIMQPLALSGIHDVIHPG